MNHTPPPTGATLQRLNKRMADLGLCSRREADEWIAQGWVRVDGQVAPMGLQVGPQARIEVDPAALRGQWDAKRAFRPDAGIADRLFFKKNIAEI